MKLRKVLGFTLIEMMLVLAIIAMIIVLLLRYTEQQASQTRMNRAILQIQQILNAGLAYYVGSGTGTWPNQLSDLQPGYLPATTIINPWGQSYVVTKEATNGTLFYVYTKITSTSDNTAGAVAATIAGKLPLAYTSSKDPDTTTTPITPPASGNDCALDATTCWVVSSVNIPGQNLNNATAINSAGLYHNGACVPVPVCPVDLKGNKMVPQIVVTPAQVTGGVTDVNSAGTDIVSAEPITGFTAYAVGGPGKKNSPPTCAKTTDTTPTDKPCDGIPVSADIDYWRVCLNVRTNLGPVNENLTQSAWYQDQTVVAFTRCAIQGQLVGSGFDIYDAR
jgi:prepilin-type N-terminal cleavage/methylation domain-containing protein